MAPIVPPTPYMRGIFFVDIFLFIVGDLIYILSRHGGDVSHLAVPCFT